MSCMVIQNRLGAYLPHQLAHDIDGELVGAGQGERMGLEVVNRELQHRLQLMQFKFVAAEFRRIKRRLVVVPEQMFVIGAAAGDGCRQQMLGQNHSCAQARRRRNGGCFRQSD